MSKSGQDALSVWREKLEFLLREEALAADPSRLFELKRNIENARAKVEELSLGVHPGADHPTSPPSRPLLDDYKHTVSAVRQTHSGSCDPADARPDARKQGRTPALFPNWLLALVVLATLVGSLMMIGKFTDSDSASFLIAVLVAAVTSSFWGNMIFALYSLFSSRKRGRKSDE